MMASTLFTGSPLDLIGGLAVLSYIQPDSLLLFLDPQAHNPVQNLYDDERDGEGVDPGDGHRHELDPQLARVSVEQPVGAGGVYGDGGEQAGGDGPPAAADAMHSPHIQ